MANGGTNLKDSVLLKSTKTREYKKKTEERKPKVVDVGEGVSEGVWVDVNIIEDVGDSNAVNVLEIVAIDETVAVGLTALIGKGRRCLFERNDFW